jgi:hypothetical protein
MQRLYIGYLYCFDMGKYQQSLAGCDRHDCDRQYQRMIDALILQLLKSPKPQFSGRPSKLTNYPSWSIWISLKFTTQLFC